jgi:magnesium transporter
VSFNITQPSGCSGEKAMITIYKSTEFGLEKVVEAIKGSWICVVDPTPQEIESLTALNIPQDFFTYSLDIDERPRVEKEDEGMLIVLRVPYFHGEGADIPYTTIPLGIVITDRWIMTICKRENDIIRGFTGGRLKDLSTAKRNRFILRLLHYTANKFLSNLQDINKNVDVLEDKLQASMRNQEVISLLNYQKSLVYFTTALKSNELMLERLQRMQLFKQYEEDEDLLEDVIIENQQAIEMTNIANNILSGMMDAFASIISNNLNMVMKFLASFTIVLSVPALIAAYFGMNVPVPFGDHPWGFLIVVFISLALAAVAIIIFARRNWF